MKDSRINKSFERLRQDREKLGDNPKCPKCGSIMDESILIPYFLVCGTCQTHVSPNLKLIKPVKEMFTKQ